MKTGKVAEGLKISRGREKFLGGAEVTPELLGISVAEFDKLADSGVIEVARPKREKVEEKPEA